ncbi:hypothetical protein RJ639_007423 [Escallonia herrerae]|uniref:Wound-responsive family protein n=1 Tax=Escallonia herrerae TaxID=1293975 RepID=A0AA88W0B2_9ASTE|nr:hypothetical protein RJ639_007423 [Escallonia herrerae]
MSSGSRAWIAAASVGLVEALKDQGFCRWNHTIRSIQHHARSNLRSFSQTKKLSSSSSAVVASRLRDEKAKRAEESLRTVMWNYNIRSMHQKAKNKASLFSQQTKKYSSSSRLSAVLVSSCKVGEEKAKQDEDSLRKVMYLSFWDPN